jgi:hypothetical protein
MLIEAATKLRQKEMKKREGNRKQRTSFEQRGELSLFGGTSERGG